MSFVDFEVFFDWLLIIYKKEVSKFQKNSPKAYFFFNSEKIEFQTHLFTQFSEIDTFG